MRVRLSPFAFERGQATLLVLGVVAVLLLGTGILFAFGQALGAKGRHQRAADLAAVSAATSMRDDYPRLFEPVVVANGLPNPRHLPTVVYLARARGRRYGRGGATACASAGPMSRSRRGSPRPG